MSSDAAYTVTGMPRGDCVSSAAAGVGRLEGVRDVEVDPVKDDPSGVHVTRGAPLPVSRVRAAVDEAGIARSTDPGDFRPGGSAPAARGTTEPAGSPGAEQPGEPPRRRRFAVVRDTMGAVVGAVMGLVPHVMHHVGLLAGAALVTGAAGNALFFAIGLVFSIPLLRRLYRRFHTWRAPAIAIVIFAALFSLSAFVIGPAISGDATSDNAPTSPSQTPGEDHGGHHPDA